jgi:hypothetical protein
VRDDVLDVGDAAGLGAEAEGGLLDVGLAGGQVGIQEDSETYGINCLCNGIYTRGAATLRPMSAIKYTTDRPLTGILQSESNRPVARIALAAYPNPSSGAMRVRWQVRTAGVVTLRVFDLSGRVVRTLCRTFVEPGSYTANWDGRDISGRLAPAGLYFCRLETANQRLTQKLILSR